MERKMKHIIVTLVVFSSVVLIAAGIEAPEGDPLASLLALITNWKASTPVVLGSAVVAFVVQAARKFLPSGAVRKGLVVVGGVVWAVFQSMINDGMGWLDGAIMVLLTMGGAVAIYEWVIKPLTKKEKPIVPAVKR